MRQAWGYLGPLLMAAGAWLAAPSPHPLFGAGVPLGLAAAAALVGLIAVRIGSQATVGVALAAALAATLPPVVPMGVLGPVLLVVGTAFALEGASAKGTGVPMAPLRSWALPAGLTLLAILVPLAALVTQVGRESLDITQGLGVGVSAPFLLGAAWAGLRALRRRSGDEGGSALAPAALAILLLAGGVLLATATPARAQSEDPCQDPGSSDSFFCDVRSRWLLTGDGARNVTADSWTMNTTNLLLVDPGFATEDVRNFTFVTSELFFPSSTGQDVNCADQVFRLSRVTESWTSLATLGDPPEATQPITLDRQDGCQFGAALSFNVTPHFQAWSNGAPMHGWRLSLSNGPDFQGSQTRSTMGATYDPNAPEIQSIETRPAMEQPPIVMAPVGQQMHVDVNITDEKGALRNASLTVDDTRVLNQPLPYNDRANLTFDVTEAIANGTLRVRIQDWDGRVDEQPVAMLRPDREPAEMRPLEDGALDTTEDGFAYPGRIPEGETATVTLNLTDDSCETVEPCTFLAVRNATGHQIANGTGNATARNITFTLPTTTSGVHRLTLELTDAADRVNETTLLYRVSEPRPPTLSKLSIVDGLGRTARQEAGLPLVVNVTVDDENPPLTVKAILAGDELDSVTVDRTGPVELSPVIGTAGQHALRIEVTDRWGNTAQLARTVEILPSRDPVITLPETGFIPSEATLSATVTDASLAPPNVTIELFRGGTPIAGATVDKQLTEDGVDATIRLPALLHGEDVRIVATATDRLGNFASETSDHDADVVAPDLTVSATPGARIGPTLWTLPGAELNVSADDLDSGVATLELLEPTERALPPTGTRIPVEDLAGAPIVIEATDAVANTANWTGQLRLDEDAPTLSLDIDGHAVLATVQEDGSGLSGVSLTADGTPLLIPEVPGEHRVEIPAVTRGDVVNVTLHAQDNVGHVSNASQSLTIEDAPPQLRLSPLDGRRVGYSAMDPDGDPISVQATIVHRVNGSRLTLNPVEDGVLELPAWHGDVEVRVDAQAHNATTTRVRTVTLGEAPFLEASFPGSVEPGTPVEVDVTWDRAYASIQLVVREGGEQVDVVDVEETGDGQGQARIDLDEEGAYDLEVSARHEDGTVETASIGQVDVDAGPSNVFLLIGLLLLVAVVGLVLLERYRDEEEDDATPEERPPDEAA